MAVDITAFNALLTQLGTAVSGEDAVIVSTLAAADKVIAALVAALASGTPPSADLTTQATAVQSMIADAQTQTASLSAEATKLSAALPSAQATGS